ncbi:MAG: sarcosine oxidase subunit gamma [Pseudomonadota bacterium]
MADAAAGTRRARVSRPEAPGMITLRLDLADAPARAAAARAAGLDLPDTRRWTGQGGRRLVWMSPDELLLFLPRGEVPAALDAAAQAFGELHHLAADVSDARALFRIEGDGAREVLAKGAPVDLSRAAFAPGDARRTRLGQLAVAFLMVSADPDAFELICFRSVAHHVEAWLETAARPGSLPGVL